MNAFTLGGWDNFFVASVGASAAVAGLLLVALSINLARILAIPGLAARAGETLIPLVVVLIVALLALVPGQGVRALAGELLGLGLVTWVSATVLEIRAYRCRHFQKPFHLVTRVVLHQPATLCFPLAGLSLLLGFPGGLYWLVPAFCLTFVGAMINAWILLVEILR
jgi:modulator of FtsH protease